MNTVYTVLLILVVMATVQASWVGQLWNNIGQVFSSEKKQSDKTPGDTASTDTWPAVLWGIADTHATVGKLFRYNFPPGAFQGKVWEYKVTEAGQKTLPKWLYFNHTSIAIYGVPSASDLGATYIQVTALGDPSMSHKPHDKTSTVFLINVQQTSVDPWEKLRLLKNVGAIPLKSLQSVSGSTSVVEQENPCSLGENIITATLLIDSSMSDLTAKKRVALVYRMSHFLSKRVNQLSIKPKEKKSTNDKLMRKSVLVAGPGNSGEKTQSGGVELSWHVACGEFPDLKDFTQILEHNIHGGRITRELGYGIIGWYVMSLDPPEELKRAARVRRQAVRGTPVPTPTVASSLPSRLTSSTSVTTRTSSIEATSVLDSSSVATESIATEESFLSTPFLSTSVAVETESFSQFFTDTVASLSPDTASFSLTQLQTETTLETSFKDIQPTLTLISDLATGEFSDSQFPSLSASEILPDSSEDIFNTVLTSSVQETTSLFSSFPVTDSLDDALSTEIGLTDSLSFVTSATETVKTTPTLTSQDFISTELPVFSSPVVTEPQSPDFISPTFSFSPDVSSTETQFQSISPDTTVDVLTSYSLTASDVITPVHSSLLDTSVEIFTSYSLLETISPSDAVTMTVISESDSVVETFTLFPSVVETSLSVKTDSVNQSSVVASSFMSSITPSVPEDSFFSDLGISTDLFDTSSVVGDTASILMTSATMTAATGVEQTTITTDLSDMSSVIIDTSFSEIPSFYTETVGITASIKTTTETVSATPSSTMTPTTSVEQATVTTDLKDMSSVIVDPSPSEIPSFYTEILSITTSIKTTAETVSASPSSTLSSLSSVYSDFDTFSPTSLFFSYSPFPSSLSSSVLSTDSVPVTTVPVSTIFTVSTTLILPTSLSSQETSLLTFQTTPLSLSMTAVTPVSMETSTMTTSSLYVTPSTFLISSTSPVPSSAITSVTTPVFTELSSVITSFSTIPVSSSSSSSQITPTSSISTLTSEPVSSTRATSLLSSTSTLTGLLTTNIVSSTEIPSTSVITASSTVEMTTSSSVVVTTPVPRNNPPILANPLDHVSVFQGVYFRYEVPVDTFYDQEDGNTRKLKLRMLNVDKQPLPANSWVNFNSSSQSIYGLALQKDVTLVPQDFLLEAEDSGGLRSQDAFQIGVNTSSVMDLSHSFQVAINTDYSTILSSLSNRLELIASVSHYYGDEHPVYMTVTSLRNGSVVLEWSNNTVSKEVCQNETIDYLFSMIASTNGTVNQSFLAAIQPRYPVMSVYHFPQGVCLESNGTVVTVAPAIPAASNLYVVTIVPAIIIAILIFFIGLLLICLHKRKRLSGKLLLEDEKPIFAKNRKPVYLDGEMEMNNLDEEKPKRPVMMLDDGNPVYGPSHDRPDVPNRPPPPPYQMPFDGGFGGVFDQMADSLIPPPDYNPDGGLTFRPPPPYRLPPPYLERPSSSEV